MTNTKHINMYINKTIPNITPTFANNTPSAPFFALIFATTFPIVFPYKLFIGSTNFAANLELAFK